MQNELAELQAEMNDPAFWNDLEKSTKVNQRVKTLGDKLTFLKRLNTRADDAEALAELALEMNDQDTADEVGRELSSLEADVSNLELETLLRGEYDRNNALISLHAGAGGTEAQDWTSMLYRMYTRYCERKGFEVKLLDLQDGDEAGIKSVTMEIIGENAYGYLRPEKGVHRLVRISPFDSSARRHTSFASLDVAPELADEGLDLDMEDVRIDTYRASGAGGQHVNRTDSAVRMTHIPTGIVVQCQNERSQVQNREVCIRMLKSKLLELREREKEEKMSDIKGEMKKIEWGSQIRSYVFHPYSMVKDHRTGCEVGSTTGVMDGDLDRFITAYLQMQ